MVNRFKGPDPSDTIVTTDGSKVTEVAFVPTFIVLAELLLADIETISLKDVTP